MSKVVCGIRTYMCAGREWILPSGLPIEFHDSGGLVVSVGNFEDAHMALLVEMYETYAPRGKANGLPPVDDEVRLQWINDAVKVGISLLATVEGRIVAHSILFPLPPDCARAEFGLFVHQDFQGTRIGTNLTCITIMYAKLIGFKSLWLIAEPRNKRAINIYKKLGFVYGGNVDIEASMVLSLEKIA
jgi:RimJ/RimL family protein N-acetyltransferase